MTMILRHIAVVVAVAAGAIPPLATAGAQPSLPSGPRGPGGSAAAITVDLPTAPSAALAAAVAVLGERLGRPVDGAPVLAAARLDAALASRVMVALDALRACHDATTRLLDRLPVPLADLLADDAAPTSPLPGVADVRACATRLQAAGLEVERFLVAAGPVGPVGPDAPGDMGADVDLWPVLRIDADGSDDTVVHDYVLTVDRGGDDRYFNAAGGNALDVRRGPAGSGAPEVGPSRGCVNPGYDLAEAQCVLAAALHVDSAGNDTYGRMEMPDADALCTDEPLVRRVLTIGAGFAGAGILLDATGDDSYVGKVVTQGAGHIGGVGVVRDGAGDDTYLAMRLSKGFGTIQGVGVLHDQAGDDRYTYYMPRALDPGAPYKTPGSGGGLSTTGLCDNQPRWDEGTGILGGVGILLEDGGNDVYEAAAPLDHLLGTTDPLRRTGSLGFGDFQGLGFMLDAAGRDVYTSMPGRSDDTTVMPSAESTGVFVDRSGDGVAASASASVAEPSGAPGILAAHAGHYIPATVTVERGGSVQFANVDWLANLEAVGHTVTERRTDGAPPRFGSDLVPLGQVRAVEGVESLPAGRYEFFCEVHPFMEGTILVR